MSRPTTNPRYMRITKYEQLCIDLARDRITQEQFDALAPTYKPKQPAMLAAPTHGTVSMYTNHSCRCIDCKQAFAAYTREYRKRH